MKQDPATRLIPVVLVTSLDDAASRIRGIEAGADVLRHQAAQRPWSSVRASRSLLRIKTLHRRPRQRRSR